MWGRRTSPEGELSGGSDYPAEVLTGLHLSQTPSQDIVSHVDGALPLPINCNIRTNWQHAECPHTERRVGYSRNLVTCTYSCVSLSIQLLHFLIELHESFLPLVR